MWRGVTYMRVAWCAGEGHAAAEDGRGAAEGGQQLHRHLPALPVRPGHRGPWALQLQRVGVSL